MKDAHMKMQQVQLINEQEEDTTKKTSLPKLVWSCCLERFGTGHLEYRISKCGLPEELEDKVDMKQNGYMKAVEVHFMKNQVAINNANKFIENYNKWLGPRVASRARITPSNGIN